MRGAPAHPPRWKRPRSAARWVPVLALCLAAACSDVRVVAVEIAVIELTPPTASIMVGESVQIEARVLDGSGNTLSGHEIEWSSSDPGAAPVDEAGLVRGVEAGYATITAASAGWQASADVAVNRPSPELTAITPANGQRLETLDLVLTGSNFEDEVTSVDLGDGITIDAITVSTPESITVRVTIGANAELGARQASVTNPPPGGGTAILADGFTVRAEHPSPAVTAVSPASGQREETLDIVLGGTGFLDGVTTVSFGPGIAVDDIEVASPSSLSATIRIAAAAALGARDVSVSNPAPGGGTASLAGGFTVEAANPLPTVTGVSPAAGQRQATLDVALTGSGFMDGATAVTFGPGVSVNDITVHGATTLTVAIVIAADAELGARDVTVTNPGPGGGHTSLAGAFTVLPENPTPTIDSASPSAVQRRDARDVTLTGSGFLADVTSVTFGPDIAVDDVQVIGPTSLIASIRISAGAALGSRDIAVTNPAPGGGTGTLEDGFTVLEENPAPSATAVLPEIGLRGATMNVTLVGSGFVQGLTSVSFGPDITVNSLTVHLWTSLSVNITIGADAALGRRDVSVTNAPPGGGTFIMHDAFTVAGLGGG